MSPLYVHNPIFACYVKNALVERNAFRSMPPDTTPLPTFAQARPLLPIPHWAGHEADIACYWKAWEIGFGNLRAPTKENGFVANFIDTAFNGHLFMWDSVFVLMFGRYGSRAFDFQRTLDNLYCKQHPDGFISREIDMADGQDCFHRHDPSSTGPNVLAWSEWEYFRNFGDRERLARVLPVLMAYHQWLRTYRTWPDGSYWSTGWACGMDNQPRVPKEYSHAHSPAHQAWVDMCLQQLLSARLLLRMGEVLAEKNLQPLQEEQAFLAELVNERMWDNQSGFYFDLRRDGSRSDVKSIGAYWALLADIIPPERLSRFIAPLRDENQFARPHRVPSLPFNHPAYRADGGYWLGGVWPSTNHMILRGLSQVGEDELAHEIGVNHVANVTEVFNRTGTLWENYAPESASPGEPARKDFVGWGGVGPIAVLFEYVFGLRPDAEHRRLVWDVRLLEAHGVEGYPVGKDGLLDLQCAARKSPGEKPRVKITCNQDIEVELRWPGGREVVQS